MKTTLFTLAALMAAAPALALDTTVTPAVTDLGITNPATGLFVGNSYSFYNCGIHGYVRGFAREAGRKWKARLQTISSGMLSFHDVENYLSPHEMDPYAKNGEKKMSTSSSCRACLPNPLTRSASTPFASTSRST